MCNKQKKDDHLSIKYKELIHGLYLYGRKFTRDGELVKDCIHDVFLTLLEKKDISVIQNINSYIRQSLRNKLKYELSRIPLENISETSYSYLHEKSIEEYLIETEDIKTLETNFEQAFNSLTGKQKLLIRLYYWEKKSYNEICLSEGICYQTAKNTISQAMNRLRKKNKLTPFIFIFFNIF